MFNPLHQRSMRFVYPNWQQNTVSTTLSDPEGTVWRASAVIEINALSVTVYSTQGQAVFGI